MKNILVTGGAGFIGSHFVKYILDTHPDAQVTIVDILMDSQLASTRLHYLQDIFGNRCRFLHFDIRNRSNICTLFDANHFDTVVHFAAIGSNLQALQDSPIAWKTNVEGTRNVYEEARGHGVSTFYHQSTCEVYGNHIPGTPPFTSGEALLPHSPYNISKAFADWEIQDQKGNSSMRTLIGRPCNAYGPFQNRDAVIQRFIRNALDGSPLIINGNGEQKREWLHVDDMCCAIGTILEKGESGDIYNIGSGREVRIIDLVQKIVEHLGRPAGSITFTDPRPKDDVCGYLMDSSLIRNKLDWKPHIDFDIGLNNTISWYKTWYPANKEWWVRKETGDEAHQGLPMRQENPYSARRCSEII
jgi:dTDP-glucose 4,6-dehydratase